MRKRLTLFLCLLVAGTTYAQKSKPLSIGLINSRITDPSEKIDLGQGLRGDYSTKRETMGLEVLYGVMPGWKMKNTIGLTFYNSQLPISTPQITLSKGNQISETALSLSHAVLYDLWNCRTVDHDLHLSLNPYVELSYVHTLTGAGEKKLDGGFDDLKSSEAGEWIRTYHQAATNERKNMPASNLSVAGGLQAEIVLLKHFAIFYTIGYSQSLFGHSRIDLNYLYTGNQVGTVGRTSQDAGLVQSFGIRWYIK
jgi:hypothetical protein